MRNNCDNPQPRQMRRIGPTRRSVSGIYMFRGERKIPYESTLERDFLIRNEFNLSVLDIIPQPVQVPFSGFKEHIYTPDFLVYHFLGNRDYENYPKPLLVEVKPRGVWKKHWREWLPKWKAARSYAKEQGWVFHILDETRIRDAALENIRFLERYKRLNFPIEESRWIIENVEQMGSAPFHHLIARHFMGKYKAEGIAHLWYLVATRQLDCDISLPLSEHTELWVPANV